jgi:hypothetical protein
MAPLSTEACMRPATTTFVLVPINVHKPPRIVAKLSGMRSFETGIRNLRAHSMTAGTIAATSGVLFMKAETVATGSIMRICAAVVVRGLPNTRCAIQPMTPVSRKAVTTT